MKQDQKIEENNCCQVEKFKNSPRFLRDRFQSYYNIFCLFIIIIQ